MASEGLEVIVRLLLISFLIGFGCMTKDVAPKVPQLPESERVAYAKTMAAYMDRSIDPCEDFYTYSCGNFFKVNKYSYGKWQTRVFEIVSDEINDALHDILTEEADYNVKSVTDKAKLFYQSCMAENVFDYPGSKAYLKLIDTLGGWPTLNPNWNPETFDWFDITVKMAQYGAFPVIFPDIQHKVVNLHEAPFGISSHFSKNKRSRDYHRMKEITIHILKMYGMQPYKAKKVQESIFELGINWRKFSKMNIFKANPTTVTVEDLPHAIPSMNLTDFIYALFGKEINQTTNVYLANQKFLLGISKFIQSQNPKVVANYMFIKLLVELHPEFSFPKYHRNFCVSKLNEVVPDVLSAMYIQSDYHKSTAEVETSSMAMYLKRAFQDIIKTAGWMNTNTKRRALVKLAKMGITVGDEELTLDFESLEDDYKELNIKPQGDFYENLMELSQFKLRRHLFTVLEKTRGIEKYTADVDAFYSVGKNKMTVTAGMLRKPFFNIDLPKAYNFAAMGTLIGHEMSHGFDSVGRRYDEKGRRTNWWSEESNEAFQERAKCFIHQYNSYRMTEVLENVNGNATLAENIADAGGVRQAYLAYEKWLEANGHINLADETMPGLNMTNTQLFFLSYAQTFCGRKTRMAYKFEDEHAIEKYRVIGSLANFDKFGEHFKCKLGTRMNPSEKCVIW